MGSEIFTCKGSGINVLREHKGVLFLYLKLETNTCFKLTDML